MQRSQAGREIPLSAPRYRQPPFAPCFSPPYLPSTFEPFTSNGEKRRKGADKRARRREEAGRFKESIDAWSETGWWAALPPPFSHCIGMESCVRSRKGIEWKGSACDGSRESVTSHGDPLVPPLFHRCPPTNSLHPCSLLKEKKRGWPLIISRMATDDIYKNFCDI